MTPYENKDEKLARVEMLSKEWEYRHRVFWTSFNIWGFLVGAAILGPFLKPDLLNIGWPILIVPSYGMGISIFAWYHLGAEARRMAAVYSSYATFRRVDRFASPKARLKHNIYHLSAAKVISNIFLYVLAPSCLSAIIILSIQLVSKFGNPFSFDRASVVRGLFYFIAIILPISGAALGLKNAFNAQRRKYPLEEGSTDPRDKPYRHH